ncbi:Growth-regulating factor [Parasponia andersonii]|uniref:Growth-regulating factor n=1 Tax=Parasponia andersonii TaxID=3476 RepID=A0A2P5DJT0_PARAD|nr:Growth-regulating factor [Parasponia andersonii]
MGTRIGFVASEKGAAKECDVGLGLRMQTNSNDNKSFNRNKMMMMMRMMPHHHDNENDDDGDDERHRGFGEEGCGLSGCGSGGGTSTISDRENDNGPSLFCNTSNHHNNINSQVASMSDIYDVVGSASGSLLPKTLLLHNSEPFSYNSSGVMVNANVRVPFTVAQRQELERQTMIYKHMMASAPVPPQLLLPFTKTPSNFAHFSSNRSLELGISNTSDQEPWRCRRTDGKKWRCSRNVIPDQKYCERHSHKSRPRSRKHVELHSHFLNNTNHSNDNTRIPYSKPDFLDQRRNHQSPFSTNLVSSSSATSHDQPG